MNVNSGACGNGDDDDDDEDEAADMEGVYSTPQGIFQRLV